MQRKEQLIEDITKHDKMYWEKDAPIISDPDYDLLIQELAKIDPDNPLLHKVHSIGSESLIKVRHANPMLSLAKVYSLEELFAWCGKVARKPDEEFVIETKYDGCSADWDNHILSTRGDGVLGEDISSKVPITSILIGNEMLPIDDYKHSVRGEIVFPKSVFGELQTVITRKSGKQYKNSRNACAGILRREDITEIVKERILLFVPFDHTSIVVQYRDIASVDWDSIIDAAEKNDFPADGLVIKLADTEYGNSLGMVKHHRKCALALKFKNPGAWTKLLSVIWSSGKDCLTPVGQVEPVEISGVIVSNVNLHNMKNILDRHICIGDRIYVERAGDVIPYLAKSEYGENRKFITIDICPDCGNLVQYIGPQMVCVNKMCPGKFINKLMDSIRRIGIERLGQPTLENMVSKLDVSNLVDIFNLREEQLLDLPRFAKRSAEKLYNEIQKVRIEGVYEWQILAAMNIRTIGETLSQTIIEHYSLEKLLSMISQVNVFDKLRQIDKIEITRATLIVVGLTEHEKYIKQLMDILPIKTPIEKKEGLLKICFTGKFAEKKKVYYEMLKDSDYEIVEKVTDDLAVLVVADPTKNSGKQKSAEKKGIQILGIDEFINSITKEE